MSTNPPKWIRPLSDYGPLVVFFVAYTSWGLMAATVALMAATGISLLLALIFEKRIPALPLITAVVVGVFGGLTLWLNDETFIKLKPTIVQGLMAAILLGGLMFGKPLLKPLMQAAWPMNEQGWRRLTFRFAIFFLAMAVLNEAVWRTQTTDFWVTFKVFGIAGLTFLFGMTQMPLLNRHRIDDVPPEQKNSKPANPGL